MGYGNKPPIIGHGAPAASIGKLTAGMCLSVCPGGIEELSEGQEAKT
jgi:hypothetical protein